MAYELIKPAKLRTDLINRTELPTQRVGYGDLFDDVMGKVPNKDATQQKARELAAQWAGTNKVAGVAGTVTARAYEYLYLQGRSLYDKYANDPRVKNLVIVADRAAAATANVGSVVQQMSESKFELDAGGAVDFAAAAGKSLDAICALAKALGANSAFVDQFGGWLNVGLGCMTMMASTGPAGALGCGGSLILKVFDGGLPIFNQLGGGHLPSDVPRAVFTPNAGNQPWINRDATRLATVLKYYYNIANTEQLLSTFKGLQGNRYPLPPVRDPETGTPVAGATSSIPAPTLWSIATMMSTALTSRPDPVSGVLLPGSFFSDWVGLPGVPGANFNTINGYSWRDYEDVSVPMVSHAANIARAAVAGNTSKPWVVRPTPQWALEEYGGAIQSAEDGCGWVAVDELVNYFAAVSLREVQDIRRTDFQCAESAYLRSGLPVRLASTVDPYASNKVYSDKRWTVNQTSYGDGNLEALMTGVRAGNVDAAREFGSIRLMSAFAQLLLQYEWSRTSLTPSDLIATIRVETDPALVLLNAPLDPRQILPNGDGTWRLNEGEDTGGEQTVTPFATKTPDGAQPVWLRFVGIDIGGRLHSAGHNPLALQQMLDTREAAFGPLKAAAREAAQNDAYASGSGSDTCYSDWNNWPVNQVCGPVSDPTSKFYGSTLYKNANGNLIQVLPTGRELIVLNPETVTNIFKATTFQTTAVFKDFTRPKLFTVIKQPGAGGIVPVLGLAAVALLAFKFMK